MTVLTMLMLMQLQHKHLSTILILTGLLYVIIGIIMQNREMHGRLCGATS